jgi:hypothetical protein
VPAVPHAVAERRLVYVGLLYVRNAKNEPVPLSSLVTMEPTYGEV